MKNERQVVILAHALPSMVPVVKQAIDAGITVTFIGKPYSTIPLAAEALRDCGAIVYTPSFGRLGYLIPEMQAFVRELKIPDSARLFDSGGILRSVFGRGNQLTAYAAARADDIGLNTTKRLTEAPYIAKAVLSQIPHENKRVMVVGDGVIGSAIKNQLGENHVDVAPDIIIGATGTDISESVVPYLKTITGLYSASSWDIEFNTIIRAAMWDITNRGCPMNFNRKKELEPEEGMRATRAALVREIIR